MSTDLPELVRRTSTQARSQPARPVKEVRFFTIVVDGQMFGLPVACVHTVFRVERITSVPLAPREVAGLVNLRGTIVTAFSLRRRLGLGARDGGQDGELAVGVEHNGEIYALIVDEVGDVIAISETSEIELPPNAGTAGRSFCQSAFKLDRGILPVFDMKALLDISCAAKAA